ncbi:hypothetical protein BCR32DRAFT_325592 [Anaeromyces robustus]|uniref:Uncharacterized protein n=1 Tax=Anaeromyces robustus TaxID=1754192 RepID=A0A1Y1XH98_9FUNG|nr:hypothetical protein BCR32DRAFT_325592 [Anaeromyces robustus]|eukprot:ORX85113.1 hypothetical protein BCR32DRAFT_325592 [Anaeromyces robustus]
MKVYPDLEKLKEPKLKIEYNSFKKNEESLKQKDKIHPFNNKVEILIPTSKEIDFNIENDTTYYVSNIPLGEFLTYDFVNKYIKNEEFIAFSFKQRIDNDDVFAITDGKLYMNLTKDTYTSLGLVGKSSAIPINKQNRFVIEINLNENSYKPEGKLYEHVQWCMQHTLNKKFQFLIYSSKELENEDLSDIKKYNIKNENTTFKNILIPSLKHITQPTKLSPIWCSHATDIFEWLGMLACQSKRVLGDYRVEPYYSVYKPPTPFKPGDVQSISYTGFIPSSFIRSIIKELRQIIIKERLPWASIILWGFSDSPITWNKKEHGYLMNGENDAAYLIFGTEDQPTPEITADRYLLYQTISALDIY